MSIESGFRKPITGTFTDGLQRFLPFVKGGGKVRRVADQSCGTPALCTPPDTGYQLSLIDFFDVSSGPGFSGSVGSLGLG